MGTIAEFEGKDLAEALAKAVTDLGVREPDLDYEIIEQGRRGLFGIGARSVRIRVTPPERVARPQPVGGEPKPQRSRPEPRREARRSRPPAPAKRKVSRNAQPESADRPSREAVVSPHAASVRDTVKRMFELMELELEADPQPSDGGVMLQLTGSDEKVLTQKDGEFVSALQFLLNRMQRRTWPDAGRIQLACGSYRRQRDEDLVEQVRDAAAQVASSGRARQLQPMNSYERRLVHLTVREFGGLVSRSEGDGILKKVRIAPQRERRSSRRR